MDSLELLVRWSMTIALAATTVNPDSLPNVVMVRVFADAAIMRLAFAVFSSE